MTSLTTIPARKGKAAMLRRGEVLRLVNTHGGQVVDTWAFSRDDLNEYMSMAHSHAELSKTLPSTGDTMVSNRRRPMLTFVEDTSGRHPRYRDRRLRPLALRAARRASAITTIAPTICATRSPNSGSNRRKPRRRSTCS